VLARSVLVSRSSSDSWASIMAAFPSAPVRPSGADPAAVATKPGTGTGWDQYPVWRRVDAYGSLVLDFSVLSSRNYSDSWASMTANLASSPFNPTLAAVAVAVAINPGIGTS
jgi:hypothetical protein